MLPEILGHDLGQVLGSVVQIRDPVEDLKMYICFVGTVKVV